ncbi:MAG: ATP-binding protein, partial [Nanoarchaeota archaeon]
LQNNLGLFRCSKNDTSIVVYLLVINYFYSIHDYSSGLVVFFSNIKENTKEFIDSYLEQMKEISDGLLKVKDRVLFFDGTKYERLPISEDVSRWDELILIKDLKDEVLSDITNFFDKNTVDFYKENGFDYKRGLIFCGPPGNGKSTFIKNLIVSLENVRFLIYKEINPRGISCSTIERFFKYANMIAPCVIILEDLDISFADPRYRQTLLNCIDGVSKLKGVLIIATTNCPENIDPALANRPSRFDRVIQFNDPTFRERCKYIKMRFKDEYTNDQIKDMAKMTDELSYAFLKELFISIKIKEKFGNKKLDNKEIEEICNKLRVHKKEVVEEIKKPKAGFSSHSFDDIFDDHNS